MNQADDVKREFEDAGISIREWAEANGYNPRTVYAVLGGALKCRHGISHDMAVALGLKTQAKATHLAKFREPRGLTL
jgi:gp16 family phage-associated protein